MLFVRRVTYKNCIEVDSSKRSKSRTCTYICYPNHVQSRMKQPCSSLLLKTVKSSSKSEYLAPFKTYCFKSVTSSLRDLLNGPFTVELCEKWRTRMVVPGTFSDIYDGKMWDSFQYDCNGIPFLAAPYNYLLMLNLVSAI